MSSLNRAARERIKNSGLTIARYVRYHFVGAPGERADAIWGGDACGCSDDRCIGFHHERGEDCGCLPVLIDMVKRGEP